MSVFAFAASWSFYVFESDSAESPYKSYFSSLEGIIILIFSGFDLPDTPVAAVGLVSALSIMLSGVVLISAMIGDIASKLVESKLAGKWGLRKVKAKGHVLVCN